MTAGRPTDYRTEYCERVVELGREGKSHAQIAAELDVARQTLHNWAEAHPEFLDAITRARDLAQAWFEDKGQGGLEEPKFNAGLWDKQMRARFPKEYSERYILAGDPEAPLHGLSDEELDAKLAAKFAAMGIANE